MKKYLNLVWLLPMLLCFFLSSCSDDFRLDRKEDRLIGAWEFERAWYKRDNALFRRNVLDEFNGDIIEFYPDYTASYDDYSLDAVFDGNWELILERNFFRDDDGDVEFLLDMIFYDFINRQPFSFFSNVTRLTRNRLNFRVYDARGRYTFRMRKL